MERDFRTRGLTVFAIITALTTLVLVAVGGLVTSKGVGMAVPDWPTTYGYNMFFFPFSKWQGGIFDEHSHRLIGSAVGLLVLILSFWLAGISSRKYLRRLGWFLLFLVPICLALSLFGKSPNKSRYLQDALVLGISGFAATFAAQRWPNNPAAPRWLVRCGIIALIAVMFQGLLGGMRVVLYKDQIGIFHGVFAQLFLSFLCFIALATSRKWPLIQRDLNVKPWFAKAGAIFCSLVILQLILGATMRHEHAGLAIPDFPKAYGQWWPAVTEADLVRYNQNRIEVGHNKPLTASSIYLQMFHRLGGMLVLVAGLTLAWKTCRELGWNSLLARISCGIVFLVIFQFALGISTILTNKAADIATAHVAVGAMTLVSSFLFSIIAFRQLNHGERDIKLASRHANSSILQST